MPVTDLNHINIKAPEPLLTEIRDFYTKVIGLNVGPRPTIPLPGYWLYSGDKPIVHLMAMTPDGDTDTSATRGHLDHIALTCSDFDATEAHLKELGVPYRSNKRQHFGLCQIFLEDPTGLGVELNFSDAS
jgi:catechol 2,3-dioxygenase-like lactoylglutathione lyase family enzyme